MKLTEELASPEHVPNDQLRRAGRRYVQSLATFLLPLCRCCEQVHHCCKLVTWKLLRRHKHSAILCNDVTLPLNLFSQANQQQWSR